MTSSSKHTDVTLASWILKGTKLTSATFLNPSNPGSAQWRIVSMVDRNQDGKPDLLFQHEDGALAVWFMDGTKMTSAALLNPPNPGGTWKVVAPK